MTGLLLASRVGIKLEAVPYTGGPADALRFRFAGCFEAQIEIISTREMNTFIVGNAITGLSAFGDEASKRSPAGPIRRKCSYAASPFC